MVNKCCSCFHDGSLRNIIYYDNKNLELWIESAEIDTEDKVYKMPLSNNNTIIGVLKLIDVKSIKVNGVSTCNLTMKLDQGEILHLNIQEKFINLEVLWTDLFAKTGTISDFDNIDIECNEIIWISKNYLENPQHE